MIPVIILHGFSCRWFYSRPLRILALKTSGILRVPLSFIGLGVSCVLYLYILLAGAIENTYLDDFDSHLANSVLVRCSSATALRPLLVRSSSALRPLLQRPHTLCFLSTCLHRDINVLLSVEYLAILGLRDSTFTRCHLRSHLIFSTLHSRLLDPHHNCNFRVQRHGNHGHGYEQ